jgi:hypothetical protein
MDPSDFKIKISSWASGWGVGAGRGCGEVELDTNMDRLTLS